MHSSCWSFTPLSSINLEVFCRRAIKRKLGVKIGLEYSTCVSIRKLEQLHCVCTKNLRHFFSGNLIGSVLGCPQFQKLILLHIFWEILKICPFVWVDNSIVFRMSFMRRWTLGEERPSSSHRHSPTVGSSVRPQLEIVSERDDRRGEIVVFFSQMSKGRHWEFTRFPFLLHLRNVMSAHLYDAFAWNPLNLLHGRINSFPYPSFPQNSLQILRFVHIYFLARWSTHNSKEKSWVCRCEPTINKYATAASRSKNSSSLD